MVMSNQWVSRTTVIRPVVRRRIRDAQVIIDLPIWQARSNEEGRERNLRNPAIATQQ